MRGGQLTLREGLNKWVMISKDQSMSIVCVGHLKTYFGIQSEKRIS